jgi:hypothetical protein
LFYTRDLGITSEGGVKGWLSFPVYFGKKMKLGQLRSLIFNQKENLAHQI